MSASGDPHLVNVQGQHFDLMKTGTHVLLHVPYLARPSNTLLRVEGDAERIGGACADTYFTSVNITGKWAEAKAHACCDANGLGFFFVAGTGKPHSGSRWMSFGKLQLKVVHGRTVGGTPYLNFFARNLKDTGFLVGGLLGEDDHGEEEAVSEVCRKVVDV